MTARSNASLIALSFASQKRDSFMLNWTKKKKYTTDKKGMQIGPCFISIMSGDKSSSFSVQVGQMKWGDYKTDRWNNSHKNKNITSVRCPFCAFPLKLNAERPLQRQWWGPTGEEPNFCTCFSSIFGWRKVVRVGVCALSCSLPSAHKSTSFVSSCGAKMGSASVGVFKRLRGCRFYFYIFFVVSVVLHFAVCFFVCLVGVQNSTNQSKATTTKVHLLEDCNLFS